MGLIGLGLDNDRLLHLAFKDGSLKGILSDLYEKKKKKGTLYIGSGSYVSFTPKVAK